MNILDFESNPMLETWSCILPQHIDSETLDLSKGRFFTEVFLALCIHETKVSNVQFHHFILEI